MGRKGGKRIYQFVDDLVSIGARELVKQTDIQEDEARTLMHGIAHALCAHYPSTTMYVPAMMDLPLSVRDERVWHNYCACRFGSAGSRAFTAERIDEIALAEGLSPRHVYSVVALMRRREQSRRQRALPGMDDDGEAT